MNRLQRNLVLFSVNAALLAGSAVWLPYADVITRLSVSSAWLCMLLLSAALLTGPLRRAAGAVSPVNIYLRRDLGIWCALQSFVHFYFGTVASMNQTYMQAFVNIDTSALAIETRDQLFLWGGIAGFLASLVFLVLLLISSDRVLRVLGAPRWKKVQKSAHLALWLTVSHGLMFQLLENRYLALALLSALTLIVFGLQFRGRRSPGVA